MKEQILPLDFFLRFCQDKIPEHGEDSYCHSYCDTAGFLGVFDGCGGAGARQHDYYHGHTEAYMASRFCAGAFFRRFCEAFPGEMPTEQVVQELFWKGALEDLKQSEPPRDEMGFMMKGSMVRTLPTTAAAALVRSQGKEITVSAIWAGDSRVYLLDKEGLAQLTVDDTNVPDPMDTLFDDGILNNIFCSDRKMTLHCRTVAVKPPFAVFAATDGCFGYVSTPMEFEAMVLESLLDSDNPGQWEANLAQMIGQVAGDDHALCLASYGFGKFETLQTTMQPRYAWLDTHCLRTIKELPMEDRKTRTALWDQYKAQYFRFLKDGTD